jgi:hypothetical protein
MDVVRVVSASAFAIQDMVGQTVKTVLGMNVQKVKV